MPDNVNKALADATFRLLRPLVKIMLQQGFTYGHFADIAKAAFVKVAAADFKDGNTPESLESLSRLTGLPIREVSRFEDSDWSPDADLGDEQSLFGRILHAWHNDRDFVGPYGFPIDLPFDQGEFTFSRLASRYTPEVLPGPLLKGLERIGAVREVGRQVWQPLFRELIDPTLSADNIRRMGRLIESLIATLENNTRAPDRRSTDLFERTMYVDALLTGPQLLAFQSYLKSVGGQFLQRVDSYAAIDLREEVVPRADEKAEIRAGLQCFLFIDDASETPKLD